MPQRSWLATAKSVHHIGGMFYKPLGGKYDPKQVESAERRSQNVGIRPLPVEEGDLPYFGSRMHDSTVLGFKRRKGELRIHLDSINARDFAHYLADVLDVPSVESRWPVDLVLTDPQYVRAARADIRGNLRFVEWERITECEFLYDWFFAHESRVQWIAQLWKRDPHGSYDSQTVYLMVDCMRATAEDRCPQAFARAFGEPAARIYLDAVRKVDERPVEFNVFDSQIETPAYIRRRMAAYRAAIED